LVPPVVEQQRTADLLRHVDDAASSSRTAADRAHSALLAVLARELGSAEGDVQPLHALADVQSGISWLKEQEVAPGTASAIGVMGVTNVQRDHVHVRDCTWVPRTPQAERRQIKPHTLLTIRTNGNADRIGNVHRAPDEAIGYTISSFLTAITTHDPADAPYVLRVLQSPHIQRAITEATSGSTGLKNVAVRWIRGIEIPWPPKEVRDRICIVAEAFDAAASARRAVADSAEATREAVVAKVLSGLVTLPSSYDRFLADENPAGTSLEPATL
jgi:type I restriction enzyme, S subunit